MKRTITAAGRLLVAAVSLASLLLLNAPAATATPVINDILCESGGSQYMCFASVSNTVGTVTYRWDIYVNTIYQYSISSKYTGKRWCNYRAIYNYRYYVTDATGTAQASGGFDCSRDPWQ
jgi:hypothetical protein